MAFGTTKTKIRHILLQRAMSTVRIGSSVDVIEGLYVPSIMAMSITTHLSKASTHRLDTHMSANSGNSVTVFVRMRATLSTKTFSMTPLDLKYEEPVRYLSNIKYIVLTPTQTAETFTTPRLKLPNKAEPAEEPLNDPPVGQRPPPKSEQTCIQWLRDRCKARYSCRFRHDDLEYDPPKIASIALPDSNKAGVSSAKIEGRAWWLKVHDHARIKLGPGFDIQELETGFETPWVYLGNIPARVTEKDIESLLQPFGEVTDLRLPGHTKTPTMLVRARFTTSASARDASTALHNSQTFGTKITARLPINAQDSSQNALYSNTSVRIRWEAPSRTAYCGYSSMELAEAGLRAARNVFRDRYVHASVHVGVPAMGVVTLEIRGLPIGLTKKDMEWFGNPEDVAWRRPNYEELDAAKSSIQRILKRDSELLDFVLQPPPYKNGMVQAWAHFRTSSGAKAASARLHGRKPLFTGKTRIFAQHSHTLTISVVPSTYEKLKGDIQMLARVVYEKYRTSMTVVERPPPMKTRVKLVGDDLKELGQLKAELEKLLNWETVRQGAIIAWDPFFAQPAGQAFLSTVQETAPDVTIHADSPRRMIRLLGSSRSRISVKQRILNKLLELQSQQIYTVPLDGWLVGQFMRTDLALLQDQFGRENVDLDLYHRRLIVRSNETVYQTVREAVHHSSARFVSTKSKTRSPSPVDTPGVETVSLII
ncbi:hypothetical protein H0H92_010371 [Tricholoma furcatifolium]|nr:hypothetical protein H0H92_010371 [Tricholoma furcatifolium]